MDHFKALLARQKYNQLAQVRAIPKPPITEPLRSVSGPMSQPMAYQFSSGITLQQMVTSNRAIEQLGYVPETMTIEEIVQLQAGELVIHQDGVVRLHSVNAGSFKQVPVFVSGH